ncbi:3-phosphoshikimate 1-carboxyvinyltransferase [Xenorhabdus bovienii]|uniref:3-phosphoshikimate 1-carboxyvinyltransferase n=1 Tax=Xenorhabdus bovienii TaxID=40576 RepID=UPI0023B30697|nr:3-phosphoshikimate 1-carboxyvinyltransferase [Xenorhabdus bovienii]MDE9485256.1 3-phosphoshikimate 1-carboxyvinyltransferase [Xenorhabdus bovienii]
MSKVTVFPSFGLTGEVFIPSSKPHIQRALLLALLNENTTKIVNISWNVETENQINALKKFGLKILHKDGTTLLLRGVGRNLSYNGEIYAGGSGMLFRMCAALASLIDNEKIVIKCNESLFNRESVFDEDFCNYLDIHIERIENERIIITKSETNIKNPLTVLNSTQFITFALFVAPFSKQKIVPIVMDGSKMGYIDMTIKSMFLLGSIVTYEQKHFKVTKYIPKDIEIKIPSDFTSLSYIASSILSSKGASDVLIRNYYFNDTINERDLFKFYQSIGLIIKYDSNWNNLRIFRQSIRLWDGEFSLKELPSVAVNIIAASSNLKGKKVFSGVRGINNHKSQRAFIVNENIRTMGGNSVLIFDRVGMFESIYIEGKGPLNGGVELKSYGDHRICAANLIASLGAEKESIIYDIDKLNDGFPDYIDTLRNLGVHIK